jgi:hypothetical protein
MPRRESCAINGWGGAVYSVWISLLDRSNNTLPFSATTISKMAQERPHCLKIREMTSGDEQRTHGD